MLEQPDIAPYLLALGAVKPRDVVDGELAVRNLSRRNSVFVVTTAGAGDAIVVKQAGPHAAATLAHEAAVLTALEQRATLAGRIPTVVHHDPGAARLVLRSAGNGRDWLKATRAGERHALAPARRLARLIAAVHAIDARDLPPLPPDTSAMWAVRLPEPELEFVLGLSGGSRQLVGLIQARPRLCDRLSELGEEPVPGALTHGDLRWANCLRTGAARRDGVMLIDWELAGAGDPAFDVGTAIAEYVASWIESVPVPDPDDLGRYLGEASRPLAREVLSAFWDAYRGASTNPPPLRRVAELAGVRLLQTAIERAQESHVADTHARLLATAAENLVLAPELGAYSLLGLRE